MSNKTQWRNIARFSVASAENAGIEELQLLLGINGTTYKPGNIRIS